MAQAQQTTDHSKIRKWVEERGGAPATVSATVEPEDDAGLLRIDFPDYSGEESLEEITWDDFFDKFEDSNLAFLYQEETDEGSMSRFCKLVRRTPKKGHSRQSSPPGRTPMTAARSRSNSSAD